MAKKSSEKDIAKLYEAKHRYNLKGYQKQIDNIYREAAKEAASLSMLIGDFDPDVPFSFESYPITHQRIEKLLNGLGKGLKATIVNGVRSEWTLANNKNNELSRMVFGDNIGQLSEAQYSRYFSTNQKALDAYMGRKRDGLNLSERVWKYADQFKQEIEMGIDIGLRDGLPANEMATSLKQYLQHPDKLFRRVRDEHGELQLSKAAKAYHPGQGVYRSSYKNARRLAVTEGNIAFHTADYLRMQEMDFIVGQHVILSNNHTCLGVKGVFYDICDELSGQNEDDPKGRYPKDFKFTGWHPHCRCGVIAIMKTEEEIEEDTRKILAGEPLDGESVNKISDVPDEFKEWLEQNEDRIAHAKNLPYFMAENEKYCPEMKTTLQARAVADLAQRNNAMLVEAAKPSPKTPLEIAAERHAARTPEQKQAIIDAFNARTRARGYEYISQEKDYNMEQYDEKTYREIFGLTKEQATANGKTKRDVYRIKATNGMTIILPKDVDMKRVGMPLEEIVGEINSMDTKILKATKEIRIRDYKCPLDYYYEKAYKIKNFEAAAYGGNGTINLHFVDSYSIKSTLIHEATHNIDKIELGDFSSTKEWKEAINDDTNTRINMGIKGRGLFPTEYAWRTSTVKGENEDFAESMVVYLDNKKIFKANFPARAKVLEEILKKL